MQNFSTAPTQVPPPPKYFTQLLKGFHWVNLWDTKRPSRHKYICVIAKLYWLAKRHIETKVGITVNTVPWTVTEKENIGIIEMDGYITKETR